MKVRVFTFLGMKTFKTTSIYTTIYLEMQYLI